MANKTAKSKVKPVTSKAPARPVASPTPKAHGGSWFAAHKKLVITLSIVGGIVIAVLIALAILKPIILTGANFDDTDKIESALEKAGWKDVGCTSSNTSTAVNDNTAACFVWSAASKDLFDNIIADAAKGNKIDDGEYAKVKITAYCCTNGICLRKGTFSMKEVIDALANGDFSGIDNKVPCMEYTGMLPA